MQKGTYLGNDKSTSRDLYSMHLNDADKLTDLLDLPSQYFICLICWDSHDVERSVISRVAEILLKSGAVYFCVWGDDSSQLHDVIDLVIIEKGFEREESVIMTSWAENESLDDALWFFLNNAWPDDEYVADCHTGVAISIGVDSELIERIDFALKFPVEFNAQVLHGEDA